MKNIIFIAPPAAGKGTMSSLVSKNYNIPHISTGNLLREKIKENTEQGRFIKDEIQKGNLITDEIMNNLVKERLSSNDTLNGYILDGYPRTIDQAIKLDELLISLNKSIIVIYLKIDQETALKRSLGRLICPKCNKIYNTSNPEMMPLKENTCDDCNILLESRIDDNEESFNKRFDLYLKETKPLLDYYKNQNKLYEVDSYNANDTYKKIEEILNGDKID